ncbi:MAG: HlyD family efflux transporter periplasmic adaptor subunit [Bacteroidota bacterium]
MEALEDTTLELIHKRRVSSFYAGYAMILMAGWVIVALPLVKVDVVCNAPGMIRPGEEPMEVVSPITGVVESSLLRDFRKVEAGDTLLWFNPGTPDARISEYRQMINRNQASIRDIASILEGEHPGETTLYELSHRNFLSQQTLLQIEKEFLKSEFETSEKLFREKVIPVREYDRTRTQYLAAKAKMEDHTENYRSSLSKELFRLKVENHQYQGELTRTLVSLQNYCILAPASGILQQCRGITGGSVLHAGTMLGIISPDCMPVAECYVETRDIADIRKGMPVRIRLDRHDHWSVSCLSSKVSQIDPDAIIVNNRPVYRVRCSLAYPPSPGEKGSNQTVIPGMTFTANLILHRATLASILTERLNRRFNPALISR